MYTLYHLLYFFIYSYALNVSIVDPGFPEFNFAVACVGIRVLDKNDNAPVFQNVVTGKTRVQVFGGDTVSLDMYT